MLPTDQLTSGSSTDSDILAIELDPNSFKLFETEPSTRIVVQPDLSPLIGNMNSLGNHWFRHLDGGYHYINKDGTRYYEYPDQSNVFCSPHYGGLVQYKSPSGIIEKEVRGKESKLSIFKMSHAGLMIHVYSPLPLGKSQNDMYRKYVLESLRLIRVPDIMLPSDQLTSGSSTDSDTLAIELDSNSFKLFETEPSTRIVVQPDFTRLIGNMNSLGNHWFRHLDGGYHYINKDGTRYYEYPDQSNVFCSPHYGGLVQYKSPSGIVEKEVRGKEAIFSIFKMSHAGLMIHVYSPLPLGKSQNDMYRKYVLESNQNL